MDPHLREHAGFGWVRDLPDRRDLVFVPRLDVPEALPANVDLGPDFPGPFDQSAAPSSSATAVAMALAGTAPSQGGSGVRSRSFIYYNARAIAGMASMDGGAQIRDCLKSIAWWGAPPESDWPYDPTTVLDRPPDAVYDAAAVTIGDSFRYERVEQTESHLRSCLAEGTPFIFGLVIYEAFEGADVANTGIVHTPGAGERQIGALAAVALGYSEAYKAFIVRNSRGGGWGIGGDCLVPYDYVLSNGLAADFWRVRHVE